MSLDPHDRYGTDVLSAEYKRAHERRVPRVAAELDLVVELAGDGWCGAVTAVRGTQVELEDRHGRKRLFPLGPGFLVEGVLAELVRPEVPAAPAQPRRTASGSFAAADDRARVARPSRILVEGRHDAELVEKVWGDDMRAEGVVVEYLQGVDLLADVLQDDPPSSTRRYGVLVDHLVAGSKESRIAREIESGRHGAHMRIVGHPFIDVWQCVRPSSLGILAWPEVPRGTEWKLGVCRALGWPHADQADIARVWRHILSRVHSYRDLEPALLGRVEELIDFVTLDPE